MTRDVSGGLHLILGQVVQLEQDALDLIARHTAALERDDPVAATKLADEYEACWGLKRQYEEIIRRATR